VEPTSPTPELSPGNRSLFKRFNDWIGSVSKREPCPDLSVKTSEPLIRELIRQVDESGGPVTLQSSTLSGTHHYAYCEKVAPWSALGWASKSAILEKSTQYPLIWPALWLSSLGSGKSTIEDDSVSTKAIESGQTSDLSIFGTGKYPGSDRIRVQHFPLYVVPSSSAQPMSVLSFLAKTRVGHALTGSVLHNLVLAEGGLYFCALGASSNGAPVVGGSFNNSVACNYYWGSWPTVTSNMRNNLTNTKFVTTLYKQIESGEFTDSNLQTNSAILYDNLEPSERARQWGTKQLVESGARMRKLSKFYYTMRSLMFFEWPEDKPKD
jgi:hypothetical protein